MAKTKSFGTSLTVGGTAIGGLVSINLTGQDRNFPDATTHDTSGGFMEVVPGLKNPGSCDIEYQFDAADSGQDLLRTGSDSVQACVVTLPNGKTWSFNAYIGTPSGAIPLDDIVTQSCSLKLSGGITYAA